MGNVIIIFILLFLNHLAQRNRRVELLMSEKRLTLFVCDVEILQCVVVLDTSIMDTLTRELIMWCD